MRSRVIEPRNFRFCMRLIPVSCGRESSMVPPVCGVTNPVIEEMIAWYEVLKGLLPAVNPG